MVKKKDKRSTIMVNKNDYSWAEIMPVIDTTDNIVILQTIQTNGLPASSEERAALLRRLRVRGLGDYPITYEGVCIFSDEFLDAYPKERVITLIQRTITGKQPYQMEINHANISEEEKALLFFVLPMSRTFTESVTTEAQS